MQWTGFIEKRTAGMVKLLQDAQIRLDDKRSLDEVLKGKNFSFAKVSCNKKERKGRNLQVLFFSF